MPVKVSETFAKDLNETAIVESLSQKKAQMATNGLNHLKSQKIIVLSADTLVFESGEALGKPESEAEARKFLGRLSGKSHNVRTGFTLYNFFEDRWVTKSDLTKIEFKSLGEVEIEEYIASGEWKGRAGAYGIQGRAAQFIQSMEGSLSNVVGLPHELLCSTLREESWEVQHIAEDASIANPFFLDLKTRLGSVSSRVSRALKKSGRSESSVQLLAVSKLQPIEKIIGLAQLGQRVFGENYVQEAKGKQFQLQSHPRYQEIYSILGMDWHFIGGLQTNKVKEVVGNFSLIHSVDRWNLVEEIQKRAAAKGHIQSVLLEVNMAAEKSKSGMAPQELLAFYTRASELPNVKIKGLMTMPPLFGEPTQARHYFSELRNQLTLLKSHPLIGNEMAATHLTELSMGTSEDFEVAIEEGATIVRLGSELLGPRDKNL